MQTEGPAEAPQVFQVRSDVPVNNGGWGGGSTPLPDEQNVWIADGIFKKKTTFAECLGHRGNQNFIK